MCGVDYDDCDMLPRVFYISGTNIVGRYWFPSIPELSLHKHIYYSFMRKFNYEVRDMLC